MLDQVSGSELEDTYVSPLSRFVRSGAAATMMAALAGAALAGVAVAHSRKCTVKHVRANGGTNVSQGSTTSKIRYNKYGVTLGFPCN